MSARVVLCDDHSLVLDALTLALEGLGHTVVATTTVAHEAPLLAQLYQPDVCILDAHFPDGSGVAQAAMVRAAAPGTSILMLTADADRTVLDAYVGGIVDGVANKAVDTRMLGTAIESLRAGNRVLMGWSGAIPQQRPPSYERLAEELTCREQEVLQWLVRGGSTAEIALALAISKFTVRTHVQNVLRKLGVSGRAKAAHVAVQRGMVNA